MNTGYLRPASRHRNEIEVSRSRFIASVARVEAVEEAKTFVSDIRHEMPDASHHVYAFIIGHGKTVTEGMSDAGEPSGTAGQPVMSVLRGSGLGDIIIVVTRYFGGVMLGTGGLVRAYTDAAKTALNSLKTELNSPRQSLRFETPYFLYDRITRLIKEHNASIDDQDFADVVTIALTIELDKAESLRAQLMDISAGRIVVLE